MLYHRIDSRNSYQQTEIARKQARDMQDVTAIEAAKLIGHSERTIRRWIKAGKLPARHLAPNR